MEVPVGAPGAFDLVSARDGGTVAASYGPPAEPFPGSEPGAGASRGVAISADGQKVVFRTDAPSDLPASPNPDVPAVSSSCVTELAPRRPWSRQGETPKRVR